MTVKRVEVLAYAKINLMLDIIRRRTDGYHDLGSDLSDHSLRP